MILIIKRVYYQYLLLKLLKFLGNEMNFEIGKVLVIFLRLSNKIIAHSVSQY